MVKKGLFNLLVAAMLILSVGVIGGCSTNYQLGDVSKVYCGSTNQEFRAQIKVTLQKKGFDIGVDYCAAHGLVDAVVGDD